MRNAQALFLLVALVLLPRALCAQGKGALSGNRAPPHLDSPREFYEEGYVRGDSRSHAPTPNKLSQNPHDRPAGADDSGHQGAGQVESALESSGVDGNVLPRAEADPVSKDDFAAGEGQRPVSVRLLLAAQDPEDFRRRYAEMLDVAQKLKLPLVDVFVIGDAGPLFRSGVLSEFSTHAVQPIVRYSRKMPEPFRNVASSPTLILETGQGAILVEGYPSPKAIFNEKGEFIAPSIVPDSES